MTLPPLIDASWHRLPEDTFGAGPSSHTPLDPTTTTSDGTDSDDASSSWSFSDTEELVTLDLGTERIAKRALLGYTSGLDFVDDTAATSASASAASSARSVRGFRSNIDTASPAKPTHRTTNTPHIAAGKHLSLAGLDTPAPLLKIADTVLRGTHMRVFGSEIVLRDEFDATRPRGAQHRLQPLPPSTADGRASVSSSTTRRRIVFRPVYDPAAREADDSEAYERLRALAGLQAFAGMEGKKMVAEGEEEQRLASLAGLTGDKGGQGEAGQRGVGKGKYKRKEVSDQEQIVRAAERKIRKAAKLHAQQQQQQRQQAQQQEEHEQQVSSATPQAEAVAQSQREDEAGRADQESTEQQPPPSFDPNQP